MSSSIVHNLLIDKRATVAVAESCTGGLLGAALTDKPGSSAYMLGGVIAYSNQMKIDLLGVNPDLLQEHGAVSAEVASAMSTGVRTRCGADIGVAVTGVAGPDASEAKPAGLIYVCVSTASEERSSRLTEDLGRSGNRRQAVDAAMSMIADIASHL